MALARKITLISVSIDGSTITVSDTTGAYSGSNTGGYGSPNLAANTITLLQFRIQDTDLGYSNLYVSDSGLIATFTGGGNLSLDSSLSIPSIPGGLVPFRDGVATIDNYALQASLTVSGVVGNKFVSGSGLGTLAVAEYIVLADGTIYKRDTTQSSTSAQVYITTTISTAFTAARPGYLATTYALVTAEFSCKLVNAIAGMAQGFSSEDRNTNFLADMLVKKFSADFQFQAKDYYGADLTVRTAIVQLNRLLNG